MHWQRSDNIPTMHMCKLAAGSLQESNWSAVGVGVKVKLPLRAICVTASNDSQNTIAQTETQSCCSTQEWGSYRSALFPASGGRYKWIFKSVCPGPGRGITPTRGQQLILFTKRLSAICHNGLCLRCGSDLLYVVKVLKSHAGDLAAQSRKVFQSLSVFKSQRSKPADERISWNGFNKTRIKHFHKRKINIKTPAFLIKIRLLVRFGTYFSWDICTVVPGQPGRVEGTGKGFLRGVWCVCVRADLAWSQFDRIWV